MADPTRLYLDNAATSFPKPAAVHEAMVHYATAIGASPGRGGYHESLEGGRFIARCRERLAGLFNSPDPTRVVFTLNASDALNLAIKGIAHHHRANPRADRDHVHMIATCMDHNSVLRPLAWLRGDRLGPPVETTILPADPVTGLVDPIDLRRAIRPETILAIAPHASNVTGTIQPVSDLGAVCREAGVPFLVDAAQTAGRLPIDTRAMPIDLLAFPGHKHLLGPLGTGGLLIRPGLEARIDTLREGGTGTRSESDTQPEEMPDRYEPGSHNTLGIVGLAEGVGWITDQSVDALWSNEQAHIERVTGALADGDAFPGLKLLGPRSAVNRVGVFSITHDALDPAELAMILESEFGLLTRAGLHCAPRAHELFRTGQTGGATRLSLGPFITSADIDHVLDALREVCTHHASTI